MTRTAQYEGIPWRFANPDPILADTYPPESGTQITAPMEQAAVYHLVGPARLTPRN